MTFRIAYRDGAYDGRFAAIRYPGPRDPGYPTRERAELVLAAMPDPSRMEVIEETV